jgi:hypothetical protein
MMADEPEDTVLELGEEQLVDPPETHDDDEIDGGETNDVLPSFDEGTDDQPEDTPAIRHMRAKLRDAQAELKAEREAKKPQPEIVVGEKPTLESCEWNEDKFEAELDDWKERQRQADERANQHTEAQRKSAEAWQSTLTTYASKRAAFPVAAMDEAETAVTTTLSPTQQAIIVSVADNPAKLILALGRSQSKLDTLSAVSDPLKFAAQIAKLEGEIKMPNRRPSAEPDKPQRGSAPLSGGNADKHREKLAKEARATGDRSALIAYDESLKQKAA